MIEVSSSLRRIILSKRRYSKHVDRDEQLCKIQGQLGVERSEVEVRKLRGRVRRESRVKVVQREFSPLFDRSQ